MAKGKWRVSHTYAAGAEFWQTYRLRDEAGVDHSGNREIAGSFDTKAAAQARADELNAQEEDGEPEKRYSIVWGRTGRAGFVTIKATLGQFQRVAEFLAGSGEELETLQLQNFKDGDAYYDGNGALFGRVYYRKYGLYDIVVE